MVAADRGDNDVGPDIIRDLEDGLDWIAFPGIDWNHPPFLDELQFLRNDVDAVYRTGTFEEGELPTMGSHHAGADDGHHVAGLDVSIVGAHDGAIKRLHCRPLGVRNFLGDRSTHFSRKRHVLGQTTRNAVPDRNRFDT
jgi:hypothetical protein